MRVEQLCKQRVFDACGDCHYVRIVTKMTGIENLQVNTAKFQWDNSVWGLEIIKPVTGVIGLMLR